MLIICENEDKNNSKIRSQLFRHIEVETEMCFFSGRQMLCSFSVYGLRAQKAWICSEQKAESNQYQRGTQPTGPPNGSAGKKSKVHHRKDQYTLLMEIIINTSYTELLWSDLNHSTIGLEIFTLKTISSKNITFTF